jgi:glutamate synthase (NADPH/NADH) large chain
VQTDGKLQTGRDVVIAALLGAEEFGFATMPLISMGCIMMRKCHLNTCAVGIATQDPVLRARFTGTPEHVINFFFFIAEQMRQHMAKLGFRTVDEMVGHVEKIELHIDDAHWKAKGIDLSSSSIADAALARAPPHHLPGSRTRNPRSTTRSSPRPARASNRRHRSPTSFAIRNVHRTVGAMLGGEIARRYGSCGPARRHHPLQVPGSAGQSFGASCPAASRSNSKATPTTISARGSPAAASSPIPPKTSSFLPEESILVGNVVALRRHRGEVFLNGIAGERFAVRNSGANAVVEGVGDHGCEYMTNGRVIVLGPTGRNFAAGMSGGIAYVYDDQGDFSIAPLQQGQRRSRAARRSRRRRAASAACSRAIATSPAARAPPGFSNTGPTRSPSSSRSSRTSTSACSA